jgi:hypothetical protein
LEHWSLEDLWEESIFVRSIVSADGGMKTLGLGEEIV